MRLTSLVAAMLLTVTAVPAAACDYYRADASGGMYLVFNPKGAARYSYGAAPYDTDTYQLGLQFPRRKDGIFSLNLIWPESTSVSEGLMLDPTWEVLGYWRKEQPAPGSVLVISTGSKEFDRAAGWDLRSYDGVRKVFTNRVLVDLNKYRSVTVSVIEPTGKVYAAEKFRLPRWNSLVGMLSRMGSRLQSYARRGGGFDVKECGIWPKAD